MQQQINLFQPVFRRETKVFSARALAQVLALAVVLIVASFALLQLQLGRHDATHALLDGQFRQLDSQLQALEARADSGELAEFDARIKELETQLADGAAELTALQAQMHGRDMGFAALLETLARHPRDGVWLTAIRTQDGALELEGRALDHERLLSYLDELNADTDMGRWPLTAVRLDRETDAEQPALLHFVLRSTEGAEALE
ncbi:MAG TPA: PilN domain-containing protein [Gammaproteobacteria bacterium]